MADASESRRVLYSGQVQGVGFRYTARKVAQGHAVTGFVRNLPDGRVELYAEGTPAELTRFLADVAQSMSGYIDAQDAQSGPAQGKYHSFDVAF
jgi:acylphosphatase